MKDADFNLQGNNCKNSKRMYNLQTNREKWNDLKNI